VRRVHVVAAREHERVDGIEHALGRRRIRGRQQDGEHAGAA